MIITLINELVGIKSIATLINLLYIDKTKKLANKLVERIFISTLHLFEIFLYNAQIYLPYEWFKMKKKSYILSIVHNPCLDIFSSVLKIVIILLTY